MATRKVCLRFNAGADPYNMAVLSTHDASFGQQQKHGSLQGYIVLLGSADFDQNKPVFPIDWGSSKVRRVVRSTLAAEAAAAELCYDQATYVR
eukprot:6189967-Alexandrium_andersonii.AAC.1